ncbi:MAG: F0F1 ATP synthase subunit epsilon [Rhizobiales bacterium 24-66-13]|jgi:F-type H+-transporting ATPase subunit epsilon|uniref:F0F1 ATP synthase subunit epsilon n=1 Tax=Roseixanthobacter finlandensis TaxID=3119922 RepID=UPI000BD3AF77|nr:MAG: F0F1 ATP synthase subunit epsilon [Rhizobiales bacterium 12-66-7]OYZ62220.1 MAG: F0F1 ATP synthase subunit epsilon [Rhizobiales bacterium 24-66-13]HQS11195.1 F0F1 ATP synthase subunit epsilon [Xanthobacteraceae bacterium]HQS48472.1 F0F1 ATP synthase subunit epsilon [Xanthobacteraceae bacterium]
MATFPFELVSPEKLLFSGQVQEVGVPGSEGDFGVMAGHAPFIATLRPGILTIHADGGAKRLFVRGGLAEVNPTGLTVLAERAVPVEEIKPEMLRQLIKDAQEDIADARTDEARQRAEAQVTDLKQVLDILVPGEAPLPH